METKEEDGYVDSWQIRKKEDCHPSAVTRIYTDEDMEQERQKAESLINEFEDYIQGLKCRAVKGRHQLVSIQEVLILIKGLRTKTLGGD